MKQQKNDSAAISQLIQLAHRLQLKEYWVLSNRLVGELEGEALGELYLSRAQIKLLTTDYTITDDFEQAGRLLPNGSAYPSFWDAYTFMAPNSFILFNTEKDSLQKFLEALHRAQDDISRLSGEVGLFMIRQIESEILYYLGRFPQALEIAKELDKQVKKQDRYDRKMMVEHVKLRCCLALGDISSVHKAIQQMIQYTQEEYSSLDNIIYKTARAWVNLTTGWAGDTPRYYTTPAQKQYPVYEDRTEAMQWGIAELQQTETPIVEYAELTLPESYTLRKLYADFYQVLLAFKYDDAEKACEGFFPIFSATKDNRMIMPFVEYGAQIVPFLEYLIAEKSGQYDVAWLNELIRASRQYEQMLCKYRDE